MANEGFKIVGDKQLEKKLQLMYDLGAKTHNFRAALNRASKPMKEAARSNAKIFASKTKKSKKIKWTKRGAYAKGKRTSGPIWKAISFLTSKRYKGVFWIGPTRGRTARFDAWYAYFQEKGTKRGIKGQFYMRKAFDSTKSKVKSLITKELDNEFKKIAAKRLGI